MRIFTFLLGALALLTAAPAAAQTLYDNFENTRLVSYPFSNGVLTQNVANPGPNAANGSATAGRYVRNAEADFDVLVVKPTNAPGRLADVSAYVAGTKRITLNFRSPAAGRRVELVLQNSTKAATNQYPNGKFGGDFVATTTVANAWETLTFSYTAATAGNFDPTVTATDIDQLVLLITPTAAAKNGDTYFLDDLMGPELVAGTVPTTGLAGSQLYDNYEGSTRAIRYVTAKTSGGLEFNLANPAVGPANPSARVLGYTRSTNQFDVLVVHPRGAGLADVTPFKNNTLRMTIRVYSPAVGVRYQITLQDSTVANGTNYPAGRNSEYTAMSAVANAWETLTFSFANTPSATANTSVNEIVLLVAPDTRVAQRVLLDDWTGPSLVGFVTGTRTVQTALAAFAPAYPNPAAGRTTLPYHLEKAATVSLTVFDNLGRQVARVVNSQRQAAGPHTATLDATRLAPGLYTCRLTVNDAVLTRQISVQ